MPLRLRALFSLWNLARPKSTLSLSPKNLHFSSFFDLRPKPKPLKPDFFIVFWAYTLSLTVKTSVCSSFSALYDVVDTAGSQSSVAGEAPKLPCARLLQARRQS